MGAATAIMGGIGVLGSAYQAIEGRRQAREARRALEDYLRQELLNPYENLQVSTMGADLQKEEQARLASSQVEALQGAGVRGVVGGLGRVEAGNQAVNRQIGADLDMQRKQIDQMIAQEDSRLLSIQEQREMQDISALSSQYNMGNQMFWGGLSGIGNVGMNMATKLPGSTGEQKQTQSNMFSNRPEIGGLWQ
jgi:small-conductance mechanosensitive channel